MRAKLIFVIVFLLAKISYSQDLKPIAVASPEQASLGKFGSIEMGAYTGTPGISIPLYSIESKGISIPIILQYHPSGVQVEQEATWVGLGWDLSVGGSISQQINGTLDQEEDLSPYIVTYNQVKADLAGVGGYPNMEYAYLSQNICITWTCPDIYQLNDFVNIKVNNWGRPDIYSVTLPRGSFQFHFDPLTHELIQFGNRNDEYFVEKANNTTQYQSEWTIKDSKGNS